jgi:hypothetical protein
MLRTWSLLQPGYNQAPQSSLPGVAYVSRIASVLAAPIAALVLLATAAQAQVLTIDDVSQPETSGGGTTVYTFTVALSAAAPAPGVTFDIATADGSATAADNDYVPRSLTGQTIPTGNTTYSFAVTVNGDDTVEANRLVRWPH